MCRYKSSQCPPKCTLNLHFQVQVCGNIEIITIHFYIINICSKVWPKVYLFFWFLRLPGACCRITSSHLGAFSVSLQSMRLRLWLGGSVITSLHWAGALFLELSRCRAISSAIKLFRSTSCRLLRRRAEAELLPVCDGDPGAPERTLTFAMAPLRPTGQQVQTETFNVSNGLPLCTSITESFWGTQLRDLRITITLIEQADG